MSRLLRVAGVVAVLRFYRTMLKQINESAEMIMQFDFVRRMSY